MNPTSPHPKIALIEDDISILTLYKLKLNKEGIDVLTAKNGIEGLKLIEKENPDLVLLDLKMPQMDGEEMLKILRGKDWGQNARVIILTNISKDEAPMSLRALGVEGYLVKVLLTPGQVVETIKRALNI